MGQPENLRKTHEMDQFHGILGVFSESILIFLENIQKFFREIDLFDITSFFGLDFFKFSGLLCLSSILCVCVLWTNMRALSNVIQPTAIDRCTPPPLKLDPQNLCFGDTT